MCLMRGAPVSNLPVQLDGHALPAPVEALDALPKGQPKVAETRPSQVPAAPGGQCMPASLLRDIVLVIRRVLSGIFRRRRTPPIDTSQWTATTASDTRHDYRPMALRPPTKRYYRQVVRPIPLDEISPRAARIVKRSGKAWITRNSACPCGSGRRFKRCCLAAR